MTFEATGLPRSVPSLDADSKMTYCKLLISSEQLQMLMEYCGNDLGTVETITGCTCQVSEIGVCFPSTSDRVMILKGSLVSVCIAIQIVVEVFRVCSTADRSNSRYIIGTVETAVVRFKLVVPNSVVGMIMGKHGQDIKSLAIENSVRIQISKRIPHILERIVTIVGRADHVCKAGFFVIETIQADHRTSEHGSRVSYPIPKLRIPVNINANLSLLNLFPLSPISDSERLTCVSSSASNNILFEESSFDALIRSLSETVDQLSQYPKLLSEIRNA